MPSELSKNVSKNIRHIRKEFGLSQQELSTKAGFSLNYISQVERQLIDPTTTALEKISKALKVSPKELFKD